MNNTAVHITYLAEACIDEKLSDTNFFILAEGLLANEIAFNESSKVGNFECIRQFKKGKKQVKNIIKQLKPLVKKGDIKDSLKVKSLLREGNACIDDTNKAILDVPTDNIDAVLSFIIMDIRDFIKWFIPIILTFGLAQIVVTLKRSLAVYEGIVAYIKDGKPISEAFNQVKVRYSHDIKEFKTSLKKLEKIYQDNCKE